MRTPIQPLFILGRADKELNQRRCFGTEPISPILLNVIKKAMGEFALEVLEQSGWQLEDAKDFIKENYPGVLLEEENKNITIVFPIKMVQGKEYYEIDVNTLMTREAMEQMLERFKAK